MNEKILRIKSHAKVNLRLEVLGRRDDGYHLLRMINCDLDLHDELELREHSSGIFLECDHPELPADAANLAWKAAEALSKATQCMKGARIKLKKRIPVAAGLGGGSSNAAAVLRGLNDLWKLRLSGERLREIGLGIGADVPYFLYGGPALVEGIGEKLSPFSIGTGADIALVNPGYPVSTKAVYEAYDLTLTQRSLHTMFHRLISTLDDFSGVLRNDLEPVVSEKHPEINGMKAVLGRHGALGSLMSGSGPTVFGIFRDADAIDGVVDDCASRGWRAIKTRLVTGGKNRP